MSQIAILYYFWVLYIQIFEQKKDIIDTWGPFLERSGNLTGPKSYLKSKSQEK